MLRDNGVALALGAAAILTGAGLLKRSSGSRAHSDRKMSDFEVEYLRQREMELRQREMELLHQEITRAVPDSPYRMMRSQHDGYYYYAYDPHGSLEARRDRQNTAADGRAAADHDPWKLTRRPL